MNWLLNLVIFSLLISCTPVYAYTVCENELDLTKATAAVPVYLSKDEWQAAYDNLMTLEPAYPTPYNVWTAYTIHRDFRQQSLKFKKNRDKQQHCFMGCLISNRTDYTTAAYMAWYKEYLDISDCDEHSDFDLLDIAATLKGAEFGVKTPANSDASVCFDWCQENIVKKK